MTQPAQTTGGFVNIDARCAYYAQHVVNSRGQPKQSKNLETTVRKALGVLREDGVFALHIYLQSAAGDARGEVVERELMRLWRDDTVGHPLPDGEDDRACVIALTEHLQQLLLARKLAERMMVYALYALRVENKKSR